MFFIFILGSDLFHILYYKLCWLTRFRWRVLGNILNLYQSNYIFVLTHFITSVADEQPAQLTETTCFTCGCQENKLHYALLEKPLWPHTDKRDGPTVTVQGCPEEFLWHSLLFPPPRPPDKINFPITVLVLKGRNTAIWRGRQCYVLVQQGGQEITTSIYFQLPFYAALSKTLGIPSKCTSRDTLGQFSLVSLKP